MVGYIHSFWFIQEFFETFVSPIDDESRACQKQNGRENQWTFFSNELNFAHVEHTTDSSQMLWKKDRHSINSLINHNLLMAKFTFLINSQMGQFCCKVWFTFYVLSSSFLFYNAHETSSLFYDFSWSFYCKLRSWEFECKSYYRRRLSPLW